MRLLSSLRSTLVGAVALVALAGEAASLPDSMALPAVYNAHGIVTTTMVARVGTRIRSFATSNRARDVLTIDDDGTFEWAYLIGDGSPATGAWSETETNVLSRVYDADVDGRAGEMLASMLRGVPGFRNADVTCSVIPRAVAVRRGGDRLEGTDRIDFKVRSGRARMTGRMVFRWTGRRTN